MGFETKEFKVKTVDGEEKIEKRPDFEKRTKLNREIHICKEYLGGLSHKEFEKFPRTEKMKYYLFEEMERRREDFFMRKQKEDISR